MRVICYKRWKSQLAGYWNRDLSLAEYDAVAKSNVDEFLFCRKAGSSTLPKRLYPQR